MKLTIIGSGSSGNCYLFTPDKAKGCSLVIEAGLHFRELTRATRGDIAGIGACIITHEHKDHAGYVREVIDHGVPVYATRGTRDVIESWPKMRLAKGRVKTLEEGQTIGIGGFTIMPFKTVHDAKEPCGFYMHHIEMGYVVFATDTAYIPNTFHRIDTILIECNYEEARLAARNDIPEEVKDRIRQSHMSIDTCIEALKANDMDHPGNIVLIHISDDDGDARTFRERVQAEFRDPGLKVEAAAKGMELDISTTPF